MSVAFGLRVLVLCCVVICLFNVGCVVVCVVVCLLCLLCVIVMLCCGLPVHVHAQLPSTYYA